MAELALDDGRLRIGDALLVYLERAYAPAEPLPPGAVPRPHGVAPAALSPTGEVMAPVPAGEAIWLGFQALDRARPVRVRVRVDDREEANLTCPPDTRLVGLPCGEGVRPFGAAAAPGANTFERLALTAWVPDATTVTIQLVRPERFARLTGTVPEPIDPDRGYGGWRLP